MNYKKIIKILANFALLTSFILTFFLDLTGLELHQYLGIAAAGILTIHVITHYGWIMKVTVRLFKKMPGRVRLYYLLDGLLLISIVVITDTGLLISTWFQSYISNYLLLRSIHIISSIGGLLLLIMKMSLHWKYFAKILTPLRFMNKRNPLSDPTPAAAKNASFRNRREALKTIGVISAVGIFGVYKAASAMIIPKSTVTLLPEVKPIADAPAVAQTAVPTATMTPQEEPITLTAHTGGGQQRGRRQGTSSQENLSQPTPEQTPEQVIPQSTPEVIVSEQPDTNQPIEDCIVRCNRACVFPGFCRRYIDQNQNQLCDLGECLPI